MQYCVVKNTITVIDGSKNLIEVMFQNAANAGYSEAEVEILTEAEYQDRVENTPKPPTPKTEIEILEEKVETQNATIGEILEIIIPSILELMV